MKKIGLIVLAMSFTGSLEARELARAGAATIVARFNDGMAGLFPYNNQAEELAAAQICVFDVYKDWAQTYTDIISKTPDLDASDLNTVSDLVKKLETAKGTLAEFDEYFGAQISAKVRSTMESFRSSQKMSLRAVDEGITLADVKEAKLKFSFTQCADPSFVAAAKSSFDPAFLNESITFNKYTLPPTTAVVWSPSGLGGFAYDVSKYAETVPTTSTRYDFLRRNLRRFN